MNIQKMHYDFKAKINKIDSNKYRNMKIPEIDWKLNEAQYLYILLIAEPRVKSYLGFETSQRTTDDIASIVVDDKEINATPIGTDYMIPLPTDPEYMFYLSSYAIASKGECTDVRLDVTVAQHGDRNNTSEFHKPSFEWRETNIRFFEDGIKIFAKGEFVVNKLFMSYIRKPLYMHYAEGFLAGGYKLPGESTALTGTQNCELPEHTHREIVDLAVALATGDLELPTAYQFKMSKLKLNQLVTT